MTHQNYQEMLAAQALNALDADDAQVLDTHLEACAECRSQLSELQNTGAWLAFAALERKPVEPSREVRERILQAVRSDSLTSKVVDRTKKRRTWTSGQNWAAIAAGLVFVVLGASLFVLWRQNRNARNEATRLAAQIQEAEAERARLQEAIALMTAPGSRVSELAGTSEMPGAHAMLAFDKSGRAILMARGLPPPPQGKAYQLWFIAGGRPMPGKVFSTNSSGDGMLNDQIPAEAREAAVYAVTLEPATGVQQPTGAMYLKSKS